MQRVKSNLDCLDLQLELGIEADMIWITVKGLRRIKQSDLNLVSKILDDVGFSATNPDVIFFPGWWRNPFLIRKGKGGYAAAFDQICHELKLNGRQVIPLNEFAELLYGALLQNLSNQEHNEYCMSRR